ncbi:MAG: beta-ketoacyl-ACP synthase III, partial [Gemmataceae bacterium]
VQPDEWILPARGSKPMTHSNTVTIRGSGSCVPPRIIGNDLFTQSLDTSDEWIRTRTGISERRFVGPGESSSSLGAAAGHRALEAAGLTAADIDLIICATVTPDYMCPSVSCQIQASLGCRPIPAFDLAAGCSGFIYAISAAENFIRAGTARHVLVIGADVLSRVVDETDRNTCILFGDGAGAVVLSADAAESGHGLRKVRLYSDGSRQELIQLPSMVTQALSGAEEPLQFIRMNGREVFKFAVHRMTELIQLGQRDCLELGLPPIDLIVPHQVNRRIIDAAVASTGFDAGRVMMNLEKYGNTSAASVPIALDEAIREGRCHPGDTILMVAFGGGLTWSSVLVTM